MKLHTGQDICGPGSSKDKRQLYLAEAIFKLSASKGIDLRLDSYTEPNDHQAKVSIRIGLNEHLSTYPNFSLPFDYFYGGSAYLDNWTDLPNASFEENVVARLTKFIWGIYKERMRLSGHNNHNVSNATLVGAVNPNPHMVLAADRITCNNGTLDRELQDLRDTLDDKQSKINALEGELSYLRAMVSHLATQAQQTDQLVQKLEKLTNKKDASLGFGLSDMKVGD